jgi:hypothetical protein
MRFSAIFIASLASTGVALPQYGNPLQGGNVGQWSPNQQPYPDQQPYRNQGGYDQQPYPDQQPYRNQGGYDRPDYAPQAYPAYGQGQPRYEQEQESSRPYSSVADLASGIHDSILGGITSVGQGLANGISGAIGAGINLGKGVLGGITDLLSGTLGFSADMIEAFTGLRPWKKAYTDQLLEMREAIIPIVQKYAAEAAEQQQE